jgi:putative oxidoreductase
MITESVSRPASQVNGRTNAAPAWQRAAHAFFATQPTITGTLLRLALAATMFPHGAQKALGWFGGFGFSKTVGFFVSGGMPAPLATLVIAAEFLGSIALAFGFFTRWSAFGIGLVMLGAVGMVHSHNGFFMNWMGNQKGEGVEYFIPVIAIALVLLAKGGGRWALDRILAERIFKGSRA